MHDSDFLITLTMPRSLFGTGKEEGPGVTFSKSLACWLAPLFLPDIHGILQAFYGFRQNALNICKNGKSLVKPHVYPVTWTRGANYKGSFRKWYTGLPPPVSLIHSCNGNCGGSASSWKAFLLLLSSLLALNLDTQRQFQ